MILDLEGLDGAGKTTQAHLLAEHLTHLGFSVCIIHFPAYETPTGERIVAYLRGEASLSPAEVQELFAENRREKLPELLRANAENDVLILDRYFPSAWAYGVARGFSEDWLVSLDAGLPSPDVVAVLDVPVESVLARMSKRDTDRYEKDAALLYAVRDAYLRLAGERGWAIVPNERPPAAIMADVMNFLIERGLGK